MRNKIRFLSITFLAFSSFQSWGQTTTITEKEIQLNTYPFSDPDPIPAFGKIYPYFRFEGYADKGTMQTWKMVEMENNYIKLWITPEIGGKIWGAAEKSTGKEFIYFNHAVKFRDVAMRGPWTSGGIEINFSVIGHAPTTSTPVDYFTRKNRDGSVSCFVGATDLPSHTRWYVEVNLPADKAYFTTRSVWDNPTGMPQSYYQWMNVGAKTKGNLEYTFPGNFYLGHDGKASPWPVDEKGRQINFYEKNNFGSYKSYHVFGEATGFYGGYWHDDDFGFVHYSTYDDKPGKKVWIWGLSDQGMIWADLLSDTDGQYTEVQSGRLFNQAAPESSLTPFKNRAFTAGTTDEFTEYWFPVKETKGLKWAVPEGSVNLQQKDNRITVWFCPVEKISVNLEIREGNKKLYDLKAEADPMKVVTGSFEYSGDPGKLSIWLNHNILYDANRIAYGIKRPVEPAPAFNTESAYGHYLNGKELEKQRLYKKSFEEYSKVLVSEPYFVPALTGMARLAYRRIDYAGSMRYALKALQVDTYDGDANMIYGLAGLALGDTVSAKDGFSIASASPAHRSAAYNALASLNACKGDFQKALSYAEKSLLSNQMGSEAVQLKILSLRKLGKTADVEKELSSLEQSDPLNHFSHFERYLASPSEMNITNLKKYIRNEFPYETYLGQALWYYSKGLHSDALTILQIAPQDQPVILLWEGFLNQLGGNRQLAFSNLTGALKLSPKMVFPFRAETLEALEWAMSNSDDWKLKYYAGLIWLNASNEQKGTEFWEKCRSIPDFYPFYIARAGLYEKGSNQAQADIDRAVQLAGTDWRAGLSASKFYLMLGNLTRAEELAGQYFRVNPKNYYLGIQYAKTLVLNSKFDESLKLLSGLQVLPNEGATEGRVIWRNSNVGQSLKLIKERNYRKALTTVGIARMWPVNLGVGRPYDVDERIEDFISMICFQKLKDKKSADLMREKITSRAEESGGPMTLNSFLTAWVLKETGKKSEGDRIMQKILQDKTLSEDALWLRAVYNSEPEPNLSPDGGGDLKKQLLFFLSEGIKASELSR